MMNPMNAIIVDDEWLVREELRTMLAPFPSICIVGEAANVPQAVELVNELKPDVIFLDIQMPGETGFDLLEKAEIGANIIFITAYDQYAIKAFEVNALDYLLKPIRRERLARAIERLNTNEKAVPGANSKYGMDDIIYVMIHGALKFIKVSLLKCIVAEGNYSYIYYKEKKKCLVSKTLQEWEEILPEKYFVRIHRSTIVNFENVERVEKGKNYTYQVYLQGIDKPFVMSRRYAAKLKKTLPW